MPQRWQGAKQHLVEGNPDLGAAVSGCRGQAGQYERIAVDVREVVGKAAGVVTGADLVVTGQVVRPEHRRPPQFSGIERAGDMAGRPVETATSAARKGLRC